MTAHNTGRFAILRQFLADGITCMFGNPGSSEESLLDALSEREFGAFEYILGLQESVVVAMADGYGRASRPRQQDGDAFAWKRPALVQLHSYAGLANGLGMMYYAKRGNTPMVVIAGEAGLPYEALDGQMAGNLAEMAKPFVKSDNNGPCAWRVVEANSLLRLVRRAIKTAATHPMGPVFLCLPMDVLDAICLDPIERTLPVMTAVTADPRAITLAANLLATAEHPLFLIGDGIAATDAQDELTTVAEMLGAAVWGANWSEVNMAASHPLFCGALGHMFGSDSKTIIAAADVVFACGTTLLPEVFPSVASPFAPGAKVIHFDLNETEIGKNFALAVGAYGNPKQSLAALTLQLEQVMTRTQLRLANERAHRIGDQNRSAREAAIAKDRAKEADGQLHMSQFARALAARLPDSAVIFDEALTTSPELTRYLNIDRPGQYFQTRAGMLGTGLPSAVGVKRAHPGKQVIGFAGDGGSIIAIQALASAARHRIGAKFVVCNNRSYRILKYNLMNYWQGHGVSDRAFPDAFDLESNALSFTQLATGQGVKAASITSPGDIPSVLDTALRDPDEPYLIELVLPNVL